MWGWLGRAYDRETEREKLAAALDIFSELNMARERWRSAGGTGEDDSSLQSHLKTPQEPKGVAQTNIFETFCLNVKREQFLRFKL